MPTAPRASASITTRCSRETGGPMVSAHAMPARSRADRAVSAFVFACAMIAPRGCRLPRFAPPRCGSSAASRSACAVAGRRAASDPEHAIMFPRSDHRVPASSGPVARPRKHAARHAVRQDVQVMATPAAALPPAAPRDAPRHAVYRSATARACGLSRQFSTIYRAWQIAPGIVRFRKFGKVYKVFPGTSNIYLWISFPIVRLTYYEH